MYSTVVFHIVHESIHLYIRVYVCVCVIENELPMLSGSAHSAAQQRDGVSWVGWVPTDYLVTPTRVELRAVVISSAQKRKFGIIFNKLEGILNLFVNGR